MGKLKLAIAAIFIIVLLCSCSNVKTQAENATNKLPNATTQISYGDKTVASPIDQSAKDILKSNFSGTSVVGLSAVLDRIVSSKKPLSSFPAEILDIRKVNELEYVITIDKIELNEKFVDSSLNEEPFYFNKEKKREEIIVKYDAVLVISNTVPMPIGDEFIKYIHENFDDERNPVYIYNFYLCGDEVKFIHDIYRP